MTGPIIFADETARSQLLDHGEVVTFRRNQRTTGDTSARRGRTEKAFADVRVEEIGEIPTSREALAAHRELSGFDSVDDWIDAIDELNGGRPARGHLYRAELLGHR